MLFRSVDGTLTNSGTVTLDGSATAAFSATGIYNHNVNGVGSNITASSNTTWDAASNFNVTGWTSSTNAGLLSGTVTYGNFKWDNASQTTTDNLQLTTVHFAGNFWIHNTNGTNGIRMNNGGTTLTIDGDLIIDGGIFQLGNNATGTNIINIGGSFNHTAGTFNPNTTGAMTINLKGTNKTFTESGGINNTQINWVVFAGASYTLASSIPVATSRNLTVNGSLMMGTNFATGAGAFTLAATGTLGIGEANGITSSGASGNVQVSGTRTFNSAATYIYNGIVAQNIGNGLPSSVANLIINNSNTVSGVSLSGADVTVSSLLTLSNGMVTTGNNKVIISNSSGSAIVNGGSNNSTYNLSWINGNLRRNFASNTDTYNFPVGDANRSNLLRMINNNLTGITFIDASIAPKAGNDNGLNLQVNGTWVTSVASEGEWKLTPDALPTGGSYDLLMYFGGFSGMYDNQFTILERPDASSSAIDWVMPSGSTTPSNGSAGMTVAGGFAERLGMTTFSKKGIAHLGAPLPVELVSFTGNNSGTVNNLQWTTLTEVNNDYFEVEHSVDGKIWNSLGTIDGAGNSVQKNDYSFIDQTPDNALNYYRLKTVDFNRSVDYSKVISIDNRTANIQFSLYPNPVSNYFNLDLNGSEGTASLYSIEGKLISTNTFNSSEKTIQISTDKLPSGIYSLVIVSEGSTQIIKVIKQ